MSEPLPSTGRSSTADSHRAAALSQATIWDGLVGDAWVRHADIVDAHSAPFGTAAMDLLGPLGGDAVLDVGCGTGSTAFELAGRGAAEVVGVDLSARMVGHARTRVVDGHCRIRFEVADVTAWLPTKRFDAIYSRFGMMFFDDPLQGFGHLRSLVRAGGQLVFCAWSAPALNPWMSLPVRASLPVLGPPRLARPGEPGPFSLASPALIHDLLEHTGWRDVSVEELTLEGPHPAGDADCVAAVLVDLVPVLAEGGVRSPQRAAELHAAVAEALRPFERNGVVCLAASALVVGARA